MGIFSLRCPNDIYINNTAPMQNKFVSYSSGIGGNSLNFLIPLIPTSDSFFDTFSKDYLLGKKKKIYNSKKKPLKKKNSNRKFKWWNIE